MSESDFSMKNQPIIRNVLEDEAIYLFKIQSLCYNENLHENVERFKYYIQNFPKSCFVLELEKEIIGYCISFPFFRGETISQEIPNRIPDCFYLHDIAIDPKFQGKGYFNLLFENFNNITKEQGFKIQSLTAVNNRRSFWEKHGFIYLKKKQIFDREEADLLEKEI